MYTVFQPSKSCVWCDESLYLICTVPIEGGINVQKYARKNNTEFTELNQTLWHKSSCQWVDMIVNDGNIIVQGILLMNNVVYV